LPSWQPTLPGDLLATDPIVGTQTQPGNTVVLGLPFAHIGCPQDQAPKPHILLIGIRDKKVIWLLYDPVRGATADQDKERASHTAGKNPDEHQCDDDLYEDDGYHD